MKFDPKKPILDFDGEAIKVTDEQEMTYGYVIEKSLGVSKSQAGDEQYRRYKIGMIVHKANGVMAEITAEDVATIKKAVEEAGWSPFVYGPVIDMLESATVV